jgi:hypothetical protein
VEQFNNTLKVAGQQHMSAPYFVITKYYEKIYAESGRYVNVFVDVTNAGTVAGACECRLVNHEGRIVDRWTMTIEPDKTVTFYLYGMVPTVYEPTEFTWRIEVLNLTTNTIDDAKEFIVRVRVETKLKYSIDVITPTIPTKIKIKAWLYDALDRPLMGKTLGFYKGLSWSNLELFATCTTDANGYCEVEDSVEQKTYYRIEFAGDEDYAPDITWYFDYTPSPPVERKTHPLLVIAPLFLIMLMQAYRRQR